MQLSEGTAVQVEGLVTRPEHNGRRGEVAGYDSSAGRYIVTVCTGGPPTKLKLRRENLILPAASEPRAPTSLPAHLAKRPRCSAYAPSEAAPAAAPLAPVSKAAIFHGVRVLLAVRLPNKLRELQEGVVRRGGGDVVSDVREATHLALEPDRRPSELACLAALPQAEWPRLVTKEWVGQCSKVLSADGTRRDVLLKHRHPLDHRMASPADSPARTPPPAGTATPPRDGGAAAGAAGPSEPVEAAPATADPRCIVAWNCCGLEKRLQSQKDSSALGDFLAEARPALPLRGQDAARARRHLALPKGGGGPAAHPQSEIYLPRRLRVHLRLGPQEGGRLGGAVARWVRAPPALALPAGRPRCAAKRRVRRGRPRAAHRVAVAAAATHVQPKRGPDRRVVPPPHDLGRTRRIVGGARRDMGGGAWPCRGLHGRSELRAAARGRDVVQLQPEEPARLRLPARRVCTRQRRDGRLDACTAPFCHRRRRLHRSERRLAQRAARICRAAAARRLGRRLSPPPPRAGRLPAA